MDKIIKESIYIIELSEEDRIFLIKKAKGYLYTPLAAICFNLFFATLYGIYCFSIMGGLLGFTLLLFTQKIQALLKTFIICIALLNNKKVSGVGKIIYKVSKKENNKNACNRIKMDKLRYVYQDYNESFSHALDKIKVDKIAYFEITKFGNLVLKMSHQIALNKNQKK